MTRGIAGFCRWLTLAAWAVCATASSNTWASQVPHSIQAGLLVKVLDYEHSLSRRVGDTIGIVLLYREGSIASRDDCRDMDKALSQARSVKVKGRPIVTKLLATSSTTQAASLALQLRGQAVVYACSEASKLASWKKAAIQVRALSVAAGRSAASSGAMLSIAAQANHPKLFVNVASLKQAKIQLDRRFLAVTTAVGH